MPRQPDRPWLVAIDAVLAAGFVALSVYALYQPWDDGFRAGHRWVDLLIVVLTAAPFALRTLAPVPALGFMLAVNLVPGLFFAHTFLFYSGFVPLVLVLYAVARRDDSAVGRHAYLAFVVLYVAGLRIPEMRALDELVFSAVFLLSAWGIGRLARSLTLQNERLSGALARLALEREAGERDAVAAERSRIAADMHDVVGHALSLMVLQTGAARLQLAGATPGGSPTGPVADAERSLAQAELTGRAALDQLRSTVGVLRGRDGVVPLEADAATSVC